MSKDPVIVKLEKALELEKQGQVAKAVTMAKQLWELNKSHPAALMAASLWARNENTNPEALFAMSISYMLQGKFQETVQGMTLVTKMKPDHAQAWAVLGIATRSLGNLPEAHNVTQKALALDPNNLSALACEIDTLCDQGNFEKALEMAIDSTKRFPNEAPMHSNAARLYAKFDRHDEAVKHHEAVMRLLPNNVGLLVNYIGYLWEYKKFDLMQKPLNHAMNLFKNNISAQRMHTMAWKQIQYMYALTNNQRVKPTDLILRMRDMEKIGTELESLKCIDNTHPAWLFEAKNLRCYTTDWAYFDDENIFMNHEVTGQFFVFLMGYGIHNHAYVEPDFPQITIEEPCIILGGVDNYYHWLVDYLPRLSILEDHPQLKDLPIYISDRNAPFQWDSFDILNIPRSRIKTVPQGHIAMVKHGYIGHVPGRPMQEGGDPVWMTPSNNPFNVHWLRKHFLKDIPATEKKKRYFISRENASFRRCINEKRLFEMAAEKGFEKLFNEGKSFKEQIASYAAAEAIIGPHGAGFTNMIFSPEGTKIIEMFPKNRTQAFYKTIAEQLNQPYIRLEGYIQRTFADKTPDFGDFEIDENEFKTALDKIT